MRIVHRTLIGKLEGKSTDYFIDSKCFFVSVLIVFLVLCLVFHNLWEPDVLCSICVHNGPSNVGFICHSE